MFFVHNYSLSIMIKKYPPKGGVYAQKLFLVRHLSPLWIVSPKMGARIGNEKKESTTTSVLETLLVHLQLLAPLFCQLLFYH